MPPSSSAGSEPNPFEAMLKVLPLEIQLEVERVLRGFGITHNDDPLVHVMVALGLFAAYYDKIPQRVRDAGETIASENKAALAALDQRVQTLRGLGTVFQKATDRLGAAPQEIVDRFPTLQIAHQIRDKIEVALKTLPLTQFEAAAKQINGNMGTFVQEAKTSQEKIEKDVVRLQKNAADIAKLAIPGISIWRDAFFVTVSVVLTAFIMWFFVLSSNQAQVQSVLNYQGFLGTRALTGDINGVPSIVVLRYNLKSYTVDPTTGNLIVQLNK